MQHGAEEMRMSQRSRLTDIMPLSLKLMQYNICTAFYMSQYN